MREMGAGASASTNQDSQTTSIMSSTPMARQRAVSSTANISSSSIHSTSGIASNIIESNPVSIQASSSSIYLHRNNVPSHTTHSNPQSTVSASSFVLDMPVGELSSPLSTTAGERLASERIDHHLPAALLGTLLNNNQDSERRDTGFLDGPANIAARRITERIERIPGIGNRYRTRSDTLREQEEGNNTNQEQIRSGQRATREDAGAASPMGFFSQLIHQNPELSGVVKATEKYIPFLLIAAAKGFFDHSTGIFVFIALIITFYHANSVIIREVSRHARRNVWPLIAVLVNLLACIVFIHFLFEDAKLYLLTVFLPSGKADNISELLWIVAVNDFSLKFVAVIFKIVMVMLPGNVLPYRKRGNCFLFIEMSSQMHRSLVPIQVWLTYLLEGGLPGISSTRRIPSKVIGVILTAMYMVVKGKIILKDAMAWKIAASRFWQNIQYGMNPTIEDLKTCGGVCPICHDNLQEPTMLHCKHIFCEECVATWFDRERTCPMCRAQITEDPAWRDGSTSQFIQLF